MLAKIDAATVIIGPVRAGTVTTDTVPALRQVTRTPASAVYVAWDVRGRCRYVGSVRRPQSRAAVRDRLGEHLADGDQRKAGWYALTVIPLRRDLDVAAVRLCEGWIAYRLNPSDGSAHPVIAPGRSPSVVFAA